PALLGGTVVGQVAVANAPEDYVPADLALVERLATLYALAIRRYLAEQDLARLAFIVESSGDAIIGHTLDGTISSWNRGATAMYGYSPGEAKGQAISMLVAPDHAGEMDDLFRQVCEGWSVVGQEMVHRRKDRQQIHVSITVSPVRDPAGRIVGISTVAHDITERRHAEEALRQALAESSRRRAEMSALLGATRAVLEHRDFVHIARAIFDACRNVIGATAGYVALLNDEGSENEVLFLESGGLPCTVDPELPMPIRGLRAQAYRTGQAVYDNQFADGDWAAFLPAGHVRLENVLFAPLTIEGRVVGLLGLSNKPDPFTQEDARLASAFGEIAAIALQNSRMLEALQASEEALARQTEQLARSNADLERFASVVSHDLQEPLRMISGYLQLLQRRYAAQLDGPANEFITYAADGAVRVQEMIRGLFDLSRISTRERRFAAVDCQDLLVRVLQYLDVLVRENGARVTYDPLPTVLGDALQLERLFQNLLENALKFRRAEPPRVHVSAEYRESEWCFSVGDNGIGLEPDQAEGIFEIFARLHTREEYPGTGIGLALCKQIVERHGGRIWVDSSPGQGSTFSFTIPGHAPASLSTGVG
ncbi:MAG: ATP-binding protein, partial [Anaerolineae bacterium]